MTNLRHQLILTLALAGAVRAQEGTPHREPASKAAAILTWPEARRDRYIAALDSFFTTRTVKRGARVHPLEHGTPIANFESGGARAEWFSRFMGEQKVEGVLVLVDGRIRLERYAGMSGPNTRWNSFSVVKSITSTLVGAAMRDGFIKSLDDSVTHYIKALRGSAYDGVTVRQLLTMTWE